MFLCDARTYDMDYSLVYEEISYNASSRCIELTKLVCWLVCRV